MTNVAILLGAILVTTWAPVPAQETDTAVAVARGARLALRNPGGQVVIRSWGRDSIRVRARHSRRVFIRIHTKGPVVRIEADARRGPVNIVDYELTVPDSMHLRLSGMYCDFDVRGVRGPISIETLRGDIQVSGGTGTVSLESTMGSIFLEDGHGRLALKSTSNRIDVRNSSGPIVAETVSGPLVILGMTSGDVEAGTVSGRIVFGGEIQDDGIYALYSHSGSVLMGVPEGAHASFAIATMSGGFRAAFPVDVPRDHRGRRIRFDTGPGGAQVEIETFSGAVRLVRPADLERFAARDTPR